MATIFRKILCPVDFSDNSITALDQAAKLARKEDALLYLMHVEFVPMNSPAELAHYATVSTESSELRLAQIAREHLAEVRHEFLVRSGWPAGVIERAARDLDVDLIVIATLGWTGVHPLLGSTAEHLVRASERPVLSFGPGASIATIKTILCPVEFDPNSIAALKFGSRLADEYGAAIILLHVVPLPFAPSEVSRELPTPEWEQDARAQLAKVAAENLGTKAQCQLVVRRGDPAHGILDVEKELRPDLIVMATHGRKGLSYLRLGSVATCTVRESTVPVLTVRGRASAA